MTHSAQCEVSGGSLFGCFPGAILPLIEVSPLNGLTLRPRSQQLRWSRCRLCARDLCQTWISISPAFLNSHLKRHGPDLVGVSTIVIAGLNPSARSHTRKVPL